MDTCIYIHILRNGYKSIIYVSNTLIPSEWFIVQEYGLRHFRICDNQYTCGLTLDSNRGDPWGLSLGLL